jgi:hypothetical protein
MLIIHLIGKVGSGKTYFYEKFLAAYPRFDIKSIYEKLNIQSNELTDPRLHAEFNTTLVNDLWATIKNATLQQSPVVVIESSGMNTMLNASILHIKQLDLYIIWVDCEINDQIYQERPYAERINRVFQSKMVNNNLPFHTKFDWDVKFFTVTPPDPVLALNPELKKCIL